MIVVTGGAGFIGSALVWALNCRGRDDILIVDNLGSSEKWRNLVPLRFFDYMEKGEFIVALETGILGSEPEAIFHLGACSSTTESDASYLICNNYQYTQRIGQWWEKHPNCRFVYASSAATYGQGEQGYGDDEGKLSLLRPLNMYGYSKQLFDLYALKRGWLDKIVGLKFFNVFGPNEYHKGDMRSVINKVYLRASNEGVISLFKSYRDDFENGEQLRDFIYVKDAVAMVLFFLDNPGIAGIYNIGTGVARSWNDLALAMFSALKRPAQIEYVDMPEALKGKYQYFTEATTSKLQKAGCTHKCFSLENSVAEYVSSYLVDNKTLGSGDLFA